MICSSVLLRRKATLPWFGHNFYKGDNFGRILFASPVDSFSKGLTLQEKKYDFKESKYFSEKNLLSLKSFFFLSREEMIRKANSPCTNDFR